MVQEDVPIPLPHELREQIVSPIIFERQMAERGWTVTNVRKVYTDPEVFRQQWLVCPNSAGYPERTSTARLGALLFANCSDMHSLTFLVQEKHWNRSVPSKHFSLPT